MTQLIFFKTIIKFVSHSQTEVTVSAGTVDEGDVRAALGLAQAASPPLAVVGSTGSAVTTTGLIATGVISVISSSIITAAMMLFMRRKDKYDSITFVKKS